MADLLLKHSLVFQHSRRFREQFWNFSFFLFPICVPVVHPGELPALPSCLCWDPYSLLNHFPSWPLHFSPHSICKTLLRQFSPMMQTQGCLIPQPRPGCPHLPAALLFPLQFVATVPVSHCSHLLLPTSLLNQPTVASFLLIVSIF